MFAVKYPFVDLRREPKSLSTDLSHDDNRETQLIYGEPVKILERGIWCRVYAPLQDYEGYVLEKELVELETPYRPNCVVTDRNLYGALLERDENGKVRLLDGTSKQLATRPIHFDLPTLVREARQFVGRPYLWGGCSGQQADCSGLVHLLFRSQGILIPRDAKDQVNCGQTIKHIQPGDALYLYKEGKKAHHVVMAISDTTCIEAPQTGETIRLLTWGQTIDWKGGLLAIQGREPTQCVVKRFWSRPRNLSRAFV